MQPQTRELQLPEGDVGKTAELEAEHGRRVAPAQFGGEAHFVLGGSGHNAGVINPPSADKHGYWVNEELPESAEEWFAGAERREGSWWPHWQARLSEDGQAPKVKARIPGEGKLKALEPAPGSYVRNRG